MTMQHAGDHTEKPSQPNLNYASLNLKMAKKRGKKTRHQPSPSQGRSRDEPPEGEADARLPSRDAVLSHSSIYLNSQQIAQEAEEKERDAQWDGVGREGIRQREDGRSAQWEGEQGSEERQRRGDSNGALLEAFHSGRSFHK
ncbi:uncharacterized protein LOC119215864 [Pungitius pungitius]|uniref:uncharacterized protein LOC119215864 n=1 Tax=Pungitius pungitius TaxID=134920 RepID=UPI002E164F3E